jgi:hypothetical protein
MTIPQANYVVNHDGQKMFVQIPVQEWEIFVSEYQRFENLFSFKNKLKNAFREVRAIQKGEKKGTLLNDFLNEL